MYTPKIHTAKNTGFARAILLQLRSRNKLLYWFGLACFSGALVTGIFSMTDDIEVMGLNRWIKPTKFFLSIGMVSWSMAWFMVYIQNRNIVSRYSIMTVITMSIEILIINVQAARGTTSHFNISSSLNAAMFQIMGIAILIFTIWTAYICLQFFRQQQFPVTLPEGYIWGIRLGVLFFVVFAFEGGQMAASLTHTIGGPDGDSGYPFVNWSSLYGDLRVAHFFGMHALQLLPLAGYYLAKTKTEVIILSVVYFLFVVMLYWQALLGFPVI